jgi:hypothetical protein
MGHFSNVTERYGNSNMVQTVSCNVVSLRWKLVDFIRR